MDYLLGTLLGGASFVIAAYLVLRRPRTVRLHGPPSPSFLYGHMKQIVNSSNQADLFDGWVQTYGGVHEIRGPLGTRRLVVCDPRAMSHLFSLDSWKYCHPPTLQLSELVKLTGPGNLLVALGESHRRLRKIINPVFGPAALKSYAPVMYDCTHKVFAAWEQGLQGSTSDEILADVSEWFDIIGLAAFSTDFRSLDGEEGPVLRALSAIGHIQPSPLVTRILLLAQTFPMLLKLPLPRSALVSNLSDAMDLVSRGLTATAKVGDETHSSAFRVLFNADALSSTEISVQAKSILLAGFATTAIKWALLQLSMHPEQQDRLRAELSVFSSSDPSYDELNALPYLEAVVSESLRLHPIIDDASRMALEDNVLPLETPIRTAYGALTDKLLIRKGTVISVPLQFTNLSKSVWGDDAAEFRPERWLDDGKGLQSSVEQYPGYHHTMSFLDGPRTCLGKGFALIEMKIVLSLLIRKFVFAPLNGRETKYETAFFLGKHPKVAGEAGNTLPMRVRRVE
ncbi:cytochrome P450 [Favolaschia claudopus]|uniref:Cytochrome P450 n=1 Tax=Favolaschia claudopus TaxID=2862362 RepID=A0AAW0CB07_9AGAR